MKLSSALTGGENVEDILLQVFDIQRGSYHDGPGIRTVVFLKGCNMTCFWCQNPESQNMKSEMLFYRERCIGCGACAEACPLHCIQQTDAGLVWERSRCTSCGICATVCPTNARQCSGRMETVGQIWAEVKKDAALYRISGGGLTLSGGEPLLQPDGCRALLQLAKEAHMGTAIETAGNRKPTVLAGLLPWLDDIFLDIKLLDTREHQRFCGCGNEHVIENIAMLAKKKARFTIRTPVIPGVNDDEATIAAIAALSKEAGAEKYELLPFHKMGGNKYKALGRCYLAASLESPDKEKMDRLREIAANVAKRE